MHTCQPLWGLRLLLAAAAALSLLFAGCDSSTGSPPANDAAAARSPAAGTGKLRPGAKTVALAAAGDRPYDKTFDDLRFDIQPGDPFQRSMLPPAIESMVGQRIRIRGFILPAERQRGIKTFVLVRDNQECCFGPGAALYDCILVEMVPGKTVEFSIWPVAVEGTFGINEVIGPDGKHLAIYRIEGESVQ
jgi:hypothetical protein